MVEIRVPLNDAPSAGVLIWNLGALSSQLAPPESCQDRRSKSIKFVVQRQGLQTKFKLLGQIKKRMLGLRRRSTLPLPDATEYSDSRC